MSTRGRAKKAGSALWPVLIALAVILVGGWALKTFAQGSGPKNILLLGVDENKTRTDVVVLAHVDPGQGLVNLISIPRDTLVEIPCDGLKYCVSPDKLAHAHAYGGNERGPEVAVKSVEGLLGVTIDGYVRVDFDGFEKVVDGLGGVDIVIDQNMFYEDPYANPPLKINFKASEKPQHLNGKDALRYVRFRADGKGDIGRTERTKKFLVALLQTVQRNGILKEAPALATTMAPYVKTNLDSAAAVALARAAGKIDPGNITVATVEGEAFITKSGAWVWKADDQKLADLVERLIKNPKPATAEEGK